MGWTGRRELRKIFFGQTTGHLGLLHYHFTPRNSIQNEASPQEFPKLALHPWKSQGLDPRLVEILHNQPCKLLSWAPGVLFRNFMSSANPLLTCMFFYLKQLIRTVTFTVIFQVSDEWLIFCCRNLRLCQKKKL